MRLFVTGGTGFVGSHFLNTAQAAGHEITALRRPGSFARVALAKQPRWVEGNLDSDCRSAMQGCECFVHLAAHSPNPPYDTLDNCLYWNLIASLKLCNQGEEAGIRKFLVAGSCFEYGRAGERYLSIPPDAPLEPTASYPTSKAAASVALCGWTSERKVQMQILRIFQVFGEGELEARLWPSLRQAALAGADFPLTKAEQIRDFVPVKQAAGMFNSALNFDGVACGRAVIRHVGTGTPQSVREFCEHWWRTWEARGKLIFGALPYREGEIMRYVPKIG